VIKVTSSIWVVIVPPSVLEIIKVIRIASVIALLRLLNYNYVCVRVIRVSRLATGIMNVNLS
jgi:hypothetical protein